MSSEPTDSWWWMKDEKWKQVHDDELFSVENEPECGGISVFTTNVVIKMTNPRDHTFFDPDLGEGGVFASGTVKRIFSHHFGTGKHVVRIMCRSDPTGNDRFWQMKSFDVTVISKAEAAAKDPDCVITNFYHGSGGGQYVTGATGLQVDFSISWDRNPKSIEWVFSDNKEEKDRTIGPIPWPMAAAHGSAHHTYRELGQHTGYVKVISNKDVPCERPISVYITDLD